ncbi:unnamed protein product [Caenorhabditis bovis]|uniref:K Homology domain-containing protein n=1 Tax=Caenorhabditis bovis TaxID=2654633 RepID=A0A8S1EP05_9PELO|nr:unnamed protein product [Caenorhabditis bovis]
MQELQTMTSVYEKTNSASFKNAYTLLLREIQRVWALELSPDSSSTSPSQRNSETALFWTDIPGSPVFRLRDSGDIRTPSPRAYIPPKSPPANSSTLDEKYEATAKVFFPEEDEKNSNLVGRIIGPRGMTIRQLEKDFNCSLFIRGKGCMRDDDKEKKLRGRPGWSHLEENLHVLITARGATQQAADEKIQPARERIEQLLRNPNDTIKKNQLVQLAVIEGTLRE